MFTARTDRDDALQAVFGGDGYLGQTLMVVPKNRIVAVRQVRGGSDYNAETDAFREFKELELALVKEQM